ncbi:MAG: OmpA family protein [Prevotella sp.]|jgi:outer membrane protein OmpA-like peptidoglycan-associated protein|nr:MULTISPECIES: OmpA family protein [unclassified Prevotella]MCH3969922.1 OmpA family protein [Prevotella sp.]MCH3984621.1 OmpA family protein [Prevotella sp.]MCH3991230.1 OmpA family protein [Prevotella sp.]MCH4018396.1 OmpA family protein [Prevotella sp.]MCH4100712.1 OmpA family protein [Prevotella sp.]
MKKFLILLACATTMSTGVFAQDDQSAQDATPSQKYSVATNSFWSNWFLQGGASWNAWYSNEERGLGLAKSPLKKFRSNPGASIALGKWFTPGIGLRTKVQGIWGKSVTDDNNYGNFNKYWTVNEQVMFNLSNLICGYNPSRVWNVIPFAGAGFTRSMTYNRYAMDLSVGLQSSWKVSKRVNIYAEAGWIRMEGDGDGIQNGDYGHRGWDSHDNQLYAELGLNINLGKASWNKVPDVDALNAMHQSQIDALKSQLNDANAENERLKNELANQKPAESVKAFVNTPVSVFFNLNKATIASQKDLVNVRALANYAKDNSSKLNVTGYADKATGTPAYNQKLSERRAQTVANELVKMGVDSSNINAKGEGGVDDLSPISFNRRATVQVAE